MVNVNDRTVKGWKEYFGKELYFNNKEKRDIKYTIEEVEDMSELEIKPYSVTLVTINNEK